LIDHAFYDKSGSVNEHVQLGLGCYVILQDYHDSMII